MSASRPDSQNKFCFKTHCYYIVTTISYNALVSMVFDLQMIQFDASLAKKVQKKNKNKIARH